MDDKGIDYGAYVPPPEEVAPPEALPGEPATPDSAVAEPAPPKPAPAPPKPAPAPTPKSQQIESPGEVEIPKTAKPVEYAWSGKRGDPETAVDKSRPTVLAHKGERYYTPDSTMYQMGFRTLTEYKASQRHSVTHGTHPGNLVPKDSVIVEIKGEKVRVSMSDLERTTDPVAKKVAKGDFKVPVIAVSEKGETTQLLLPKSIADKISKLKGAKQFLYMQELGIYPADWEYQTKGDQARIVSKIKKTIPEAITVEVPKAEAPGGLPSPTKLYRHVNQKGELDLYAAVAAGNTKVSDYEGWNVTQNDINKVVERNDAVELLSRYKVKEGYDIGKALIEGRKDKKYTEAVELVFDANDVAEARYANSVALTIGTGIPKEYRIPVSKDVDIGLSPVSDVVTSPVIKAGESDLFEKIPKSLLAAVGVTALTPIPFDELIALAALGLAVASIQAIDALREFKVNEKRLPTVSEIVISTEPIIKSPPGIRAYKLPEPRTELIPGKVKGVTPPVEPGKVPKVEMVTVPPKVEFGIPPKEKTEKHIEELMNGWIAFAEESRSPAMKEEAKELKKEASKLEPAIQKVVKTLGPEDVGLTEEQFEKLVRQRVYGTEAEKQESAINWTKVVQNMADAANKREAVKIVQQAKANESRIHFLATQAIANLQAMQVFTNLARAWDRFNSTRLTYLQSGILTTGTTTRLLEKAETVGLTEAEAEALTRVDTSVLTQTQVKTLTRVLTKIATKTLTAVKPLTITKTAAKQAVATRAAVAPRTAAATRTAAMAAAAKAVSTTKPITPLPIPPFPRGGTDKQKRKTISDSKGAIAWRQGELGGKDVWHCIKYPYESEADYLTVLGRKPSNTTIVKGPGSAYQTAKLRYGKPPARKLTGDIGFMDFFIEPKAGRKVGIGFTPDPKMETTGDITIGISRTTPPITERAPRLSGRRTPRITPKRPALRR